MGFLRGPHKWKKSGSKSDYKLACKMVNTKTEVPWILHKKIFLVCFSYLLQECRAGGGSKITPNAAIH